MNALRMGGLIGVVLVVAGCPSPERPPDTTPETPAPAAPATEPITPTPDAERVSLAEVQGSGITGEAEVRESGAQSSVMLTLRGAPPNSTLQAHIHSGSCAAQGPVVAPLEPVITDAEGLGTSMTTVDVPIGTLRDGQHYVQAHQPGGTPGAPVACGEIGGR